MHFFGGTPFTSYLLFLTSVLIGLGKTEWSICLLVATVGSFILPLLISKRASRNAFFNRGLLFCFLGMILGNVLSYLISPINYTSSWNLVLGMAKEHSVAGSFSLRDLISHTKTRFNYVAPIVAVLLISFLHLKHLLASGQRWLLFNFCLVLAYFSAFFLSTWGDYARYFAPAFALSLGLAISIGCSDFLRPRIKLFASVLLVFLNLQSIYILRTSMNFDFNWQRDTCKWKTCVPIVDISSVINIPHQNFVHAWIGTWSDSEKIILKNGLVPCR